MLLLAAFAISLVTPSDQSELVFLRQRVAELEAKSVAFKSGCPLAHGAEHVSRSLMTVGGGGSAWPRQELSEEQREAMNDKKIMKQAYAQVSSSV